MISEVFLRVNSIYSTTSLIVGILRLLEVNIKVKVNLKGPVDHVYSRNSMFTVIFI